LFYQGSVGGQALTDIPVVRRLRDARKGACRVWPFETGWKALAPSELDGVQVIFAEIYPSLVPTEIKPGEIKDAAQIRSFAEFLAGLDEKGELGRRFGPDKSISPEEIAINEREEGRILGL
jgi:hypothetical protein